MQFGDRVAECRECPADLAVAAFAHFDDPACVVAVGLARKHEFALAVGQFHAKIADHLSMQRLNWRIKRNEIAFALLKRRVGHPEREITVICHDEQTRAVFVEATDGFEVVEMLREEAVNCRRVPLFAARTDVANRFVEREIDHCSRLNDLSATLDNVSRRDVRAELRGHVIDGNAALFDEIVGLPAGDAEAQRQIFIEALGWLRG